MAPLAQGASAADAASALRACFGGREAAEATLVSMAMLSSGDYVLATDIVGALRPARVVVNQHRTSERRTTLLTLEYRGGAVTVTPDHLLPVRSRAGGTQHVAARDVASGSWLLGVGDAEMRVERVTRLHGRFVNPVTDTGLILAARAGSREPALATTHPEWSAELLMSDGSSSLLRRVFDVLALVSRAAPTTVQRLYSSIEPMLDATTPAFADPFGSAIGACVVALSLLKPIALAAGLARRAARSARGSR